MGAVAQKHLYIRGVDTPIWDAAERIAKRNCTSVSQLVIDALAEHLPKAAEKPVQESPRWADLGADAANAA
mgnify:CR=1 FL=1